MGWKEVRWVLGRVDLLREVHKMLLDGRPVKLVCHAYRY